ncbi:MAG: multiheme c-type cytochrome [Methylicorpusculum sp.]|uniref:multiheme c-type cytochrome n=1 Tax=Methylicorpusculum sp. TaxID=2713644 RepID=UPI0027182E39|nr:multiheme c-type cytochrome [Methylicorpusculum sp.]MDO8938635.1 multiheme c-type cytochrome [Methylicorpusculum sp.]MDP2178459.1 multiheme c-type cytochrome [Methylicorpusculum sp.]MDP2204313.1 multiheme c-type cytochrome [Methylicorpusculum sp.]MDP3529808.1 multiheme c-type cytochrome [Methylicorpusculum sp.]
MNLILSFLVRFIWLSVIITSGNIQAAPKDTIPAPFSFTDQVRVPLSSSVSSDTITISSINSATAISISGGQYSRNGGAFTSTKSTVINGDRIQVRHTSSASYNTTTNTILTIGGVKDTFSSITIPFATDTTPDAFSFVDQTGVPLGSAITSGNLTVSGINAPSGISIVGGLYSINGGAYVATVGNVNNGDTFTVRLVSSVNPGTTTSAVLTIGGVSDTFSVTTLANSSGGFLLPPASGGNPGFSSEHFSGSANCTMCHNGLTDQNGQDVSIETDWSSTMMANSARDPFWRAKVRSELNRNPHLADIINDKCSRCHAPMANFEAKQAGEPFEILNNGFLNAGHPRHDEALNGVSCTLCHQIKNSTNLGTLARFTGRYEIDGSKTIYGPYDNLFPNPMIMNTGYTPTFSAHVKSSKLCATCHNLKTPFVDEFGNILSTTPESEFPEQMPYTEWEQSSYASTNPKSCQQCHMSRANGVAISNRPMWLQGRDDFAIHEFVGANRLMLDVFDKNKQQLGILSTNFAETLSKTQSMLSSAASISPVIHSLVSNTLDFKLKVNSNTGHKLPSAYPSRRVILHVTVKDGQGNIVFESGKVNANGSVNGVDADEDRTVFEPHYELITSPEQVQVYEAVMGDNQNQVTYTLLRGMTYLKDNRLLPQGFNKATAPADVRVAGDALTDPDFVGGSDEISYRISGLSGANYSVEAELLHQPLAYSFAQDLFTEIDAEIEDFKVLFNASNAKTSRIALSTFSVSR